MARVRENPWRTLRSRPWLRLWWAVLPGGQAAQWEGDEILIDATLSRRERRCALMHELVHEERRIGWPDATAATMEREEAIVRAVTADRLVPPTELAEWAVRRVTVEPITAELVADEFDVTEEVAELALSRLAT